jgi:signal peptidase II
MGAVSRATSSGLALALALSVFLADQISKRLIQASLQPGESIQVVPDVLRISYTRNDGGAFGILGGQSGLLLIGSAVAVAVVLWMLLQGPPARATALGCGLILGGAAGNLLDRLIAGDVADFLDLEFWPLREWPVFNAADIAIVLGVSVLFLAAAFRPEAGQRSAAGDEENSKAGG